MKLKSHSIYGEQTANKRDYLKRYKAVRYTIHDYCLYNNPRYSRILIGSRL